MIEHPILFTGPMVRALLRVQNPKTQTRRLPSITNCLVDGSSPSRRSWSELDFASEKVFVDAGPSPAGNPGPYLHVPRRDADTIHRVYPKYAFGDRLWVKETYSSDFKDHYPNDPIWYRADDSRETSIEHCDGVQGIWSPESKLFVPFKWRPSIFMRRDQSRITLEIVNIRVERVHQVGQDGRKAQDVYAEGITDRQIDVWRKWLHADDAPAHTYATLWDSINGAGSWDKNPWVWVVEFKML